MPTSNKTSRNYASRTTMKVSGESLQKRHAKRLRKKRRLKFIRKTVFYSVIAIILLIILVFCTPLFHIRNVTIEGNNIVATEDLESSFSNIIGKNLFSTKKKDIIKILPDNAYIDDVSLKKHIFSSTLTVNIIECQPAGYIFYSNKYVTIDSSGKILEITEVEPEFAAISGLELTSAVEGEQISIGDADNLNIALSVIGLFEQSDMLPSITTISFEDFDNITFNYENRLDGICGPYVDFQRKINLFKEAITSNKLTENSHGTINLTNSGKAIYTP